MGSHAEHFDTPMPVNRGFLNGLNASEARLISSVRKCGGGAVRARSDIRGWEDEGEFYWLDHKEPFTAPLKEKQ